MTSLNLWRNWIRAEGAKHIAGALKVSKCVLAIILAPLSCPSDAPILQLLVFAIIPRMHMAGGPIRVVFEKQQPPC
jgi:hypothetical protein